MFGHNAVVASLDVPKFHFHRTGRRFRLNFEKVLQLLMISGLISNFGLANMRVAIDVFATDFKTRIRLVNSGMGYRIISINLWHQLKRFSICFPSSNLNIILDLLLNAHYCTENANVLSVLAHTSAFSEPNIMKLLLADWKEWTFRTPIATKDGSTRNIPYWIVFFTLRETLHI